MLPGSDRLEETRVIIPISQMRNYFRSEKPSQKSQAYTFVAITLLILYTCTQIGLFSAAAVNIQSLQCNTAYIMFSIMAGSEGLTLLFGVLGLMNVGIKRYYYISYAAGTLAILMKLGLIIYLAVRGPYHMGECYINSTLRNGIYASFSMQSFLVVLTMVMLGRMALQARIENLSSFSVTKEFAMD